MGDKSALELLVDRVGMLGVVDALRDLCGEQAEHLRSAWQDEASARDWERVGKVLDSCYGRMTKMAV